MRCWCAGCLTLELDLGRFAVKDSHCNRGYAYMGAQELVQTSFSGLGANAVIGAFCSSASMAASDFLKHYKTPLLSPASTSMELSDSDAYPYFARLPPTDEWQTLAMADLVESKKHLRRLKNTILEALAAQTEKYCRTHFPTKLKFLGFIMNAPISRLSFSNVAYQLLSIN